MNRGRIYLFLICTALNVFVQTLGLIEISILNIVSIQSFILSIYIITEAFTRKASLKYGVLPFYFLTFNFLRITASVVFLMPYILKNHDYSNTYIYNFIIVYFIHLYFDIYVIKKTS